MAKIGHIYIVILSLAVGYPHPNIRPPTFIEDAVTYEQIKHLTGGIEIIYLPVIYGRRARFTRLYSNASIISHTNLPSCLILLALDD